MKPTSRAGSCGRSLHHWPKLLTGAYIGGGGGVKMLAAAAAIAGAGAGATCMVESDDGADESTWDAFWAYVLHAKYIYLK